MGNHLRIEYNGTTLYDGDVGEVTWTATEDGIAVQARAKGAAPQPKPRPTGGGAGILGKLVESVATAKPRPGRQAVPVQPAQPVVPPEDEEDIASEETFDLAEVTP